MVGSPATRRNARTRRGVARTVGGFLVICGCKVSPDVSEGREGMGHGHLVAGRLEGERGGRREASGEGVRRNGQRERDVVTAPDPDMGGDCAPKALGGEAGRSL